MAGGDVAVEQSTHPSCLEVVHPKHFITESKDKMGEDMCDVIRGVTLGGESSNRPSSITSSCAERDTMRPLNVIGSAFSPVSSPNYVISESTMHDNKSAFSLATSHHYDVTKSTVCPPPAIQNSSPPCPVPHIYTPTPLRPLPRPLVVGLDQKLSLGAKDGDASSTLSSDHPVDRPYKPLYSPYFSSTVYNSQSGSHFQHAPPYFLGNHSQSLLPGQQLLGQEHHPTYHYGVGGTPMTYGSYHNFHPYPTPPHHYPQPYPYRHLQVVQTASGAYLGSLVVPPVHLHSLLYQRPTAGYPSTQDGDAVAGARDAQDLGKVKVPRMSPRVEFAASGSPSQPSTTGSSYGDYSSLQSLQQGKASGDGCHQSEGRTSVQLPGGELDDATR